MSYENTKESQQSGMCNVQVAVRCRPVNSEEKRLNQPTVVSCESESKTIKVNYGPAGKKSLKQFNFDKVFGMYSTQEEVFETMVRPIVSEALDGFNCTIFAYGQTGTGKTHTMEGDIHSEENAGIVPRSVKCILEQLESSGAEFTIRVSFLELYNEELKDLLNTQGDKTLKLCEDVKKGVVCQNLEEVTVLTKKDVFDILQKGIQQRQTAATLCNKNSSRSHSIFTLKIMIKECNVDGEEVVRHGQLNLVDLAGSECVGRSGAKNDRAREAGSINQSLLTLGRVITALVDHHGHIPYRDSKLTRLLQESLGGKAKTCIIATLSPSQNAVEESLSTLDYAYRAKNIKNQPTLNQRMTKKVVLKEYCAEIEQLKSALAANRDKNGVYVDPKEFFAMESKILTQESMLNECEAALKIRTEENKALKNERESILEQVTKAEEDLELSKNQLAIVQISLDETNIKLSETELELKATEAVVGEQMNTEEELQLQGSNLQNEVIDRRENVSSLFAKVDRFAEKENLRLTESSSFVTEISGSKSNLLESLNELRELSSEKSGSLCNGVSEILEKGRITCSSLKNSIDQSLSILIDDAELAKNKMRNSCDELKGHLDETNTNLQSTLKTLQEQLSSWLGDVDNNMKQIQEKLKMQQNELDSLVNSISSSSSDYINLSDTFIQSQAKLLKESVNNVIELKTELNNQIESHQQQSIINNDLAIEKMNKKAEDIELAMSSMFKDMVKSTMASFAESKSSTSNFSSSVQNASSVGFDKIQKSHSIINASFTENINKLQKKVTTSSDIYNNAISNASSSRIVVDEMISNISNTVGDKRQNLIETVDNLLENVNSSIEQGCNVANETSKTANLILTDVTNATESMNTNASNALESFTTFMDGKGQDLCQDMTKYFSSLESQLSSNYSNISSIGDRVNEFGNSIESTILQPTGTTPKKQKFNELTKLPLTRDHNLIKNEVRGINVIQVECNNEDDSSSISSNESRTSIPFSDIDISESSAEKKRKKINIAVDCENVNPNIVETEDAVGKKTKSKIQRSKSVESSSIPNISRTRNASMI